MEAGASKGIYLNTYLIFVSFNEESTFFSMNTWCNLKSVWDVAKVNLIIHKTLSQVGNKFQLHS